MCTCLCGNQPVCRVLGDDAAVLARSSGEEPASPRHRAGIASMAWRTTRRFRSVCAVRSGCARAPRTAPPCPALRAPRPPPRRPGAPVAPRRSGATRKPAPPRPRRRPPRRLPQTRPRGAPRRRPPPRPRRKAASRPVCAMVGKREIPPCARASASEGGLSFRRENVCGRLTCPGRLDKTFVYGKLEVKRGRHCSFSRLFYAGPRTGRRPSSAR